MRVKLLILAFASVSLVACSSPKRTIRIPESVVPNPKNKASDKTGAQPFVIKVSDGKRTFQVEVPSENLQGAINAAIPLDLETLKEYSAESQQTEADREINDAKEAAGEKVPKTPPGEEPKSKSYLATLAKVNELYKKRQYEIALIEIT